MAIMILKCFITIWTVLQVVDGVPHNLATALNENFYDDVRQLIKRKSHDRSQHHFNIPTPVLVENWPEERLTVGQISGVSIDPHGNPAIFHRGHRVWNDYSFNETHHFQYIQDGPIETKTVYLLNPKTGGIIYSWGASMFYMPHGLTIDVHGNYWLTDVALHQVFKFKPFNETAQLVLGKKFEPGSSIYQLCQPTSVAVATTGEIFVADGYCNERIVKYNAAGRVLRTIPQPPGKFNVHISKDAKEHGVFPLPFPGNCFHFFTTEFLSLQVPHGITLLEHLDLLCIADRENMRVVCPRAGLRSSFGEGQQAATIQEPDLGRVFDVAAYGDIVYAVNGPTSPIFPVRGFTIDPRSERIIDHWGEFSNPHAIAVNVNGSALYVVEIGPNLIWKYILV